MSILSECMGILQVSSLTVFIKGSSSQMQHQREDGWQTAISRPEQRRLKHTYLAPWLTVTLVSHLSYKIVWEVKDLAAILFFQKNTCNEEGRRKAWQILKSACKMSIMKQTPIRTNTKSLLYSHVPQPSIKWTQRSSRTGNQQWCTARFELTSSNLAHCSCLPQSKLLTSIPDLSGWGTKRHGTGGAGLK